MPHAIDVGCLDVNHFPPCSNNEASMVLYLFSVRSIFVCFCPSYKSIGSVALSPKSGYKSQSLHFRGSLLFGTQSGR